MTIWKVLMVMMGGGLGALSRWGLSLMAARLFSSRFPAGTLLANLAGCFMIGAAFALTDRAGLLSPSARLFFMTGFLGALTTFSTYALETVNTARSGDLPVAVLNFVVNNLAGLALVLAGMWLVRYLLQVKLT